MSDPHSDEHGGTCYCELGPHSHPARRSARVDLARDLAAPDAIPTGRYVEVATLPHSNDNMRNDD